MMPKLPLTVAIIQARMASTRLPNKVLLDIGGRPMLEWVVERTRRARAVDRVVVATSTDKADDPIAEFCKKKGYLCFRGSQHDVLDRFYQIGKDMNALVVVRITADCPLIDPALISKTVQFLWGGFGGDTLMGKPLHDFTANRLPPPWGRTYPVGLDVEVCAFKVLKTAWEEAKKPHQREHVMPFIYENRERFRIALIEHTENLGHLRWTVDEPEDLQLVREIVRHFPDNTFTWLDVVDLFKRKPELAKINAGVQHKSAHDVDERQ